MTADFAKPEFGREIGEVPSDGETDGDAAAGLDGFFCGDGVVAHFGDALAEETDGDGSRIERVADFRAVAVKAMLQTDGAIGFDFFSETGGFKLRELSRGVVEAAGEFDFDGLFASSLSDLRQS